MLQAGAAPASAVDTRPRVVITADPELDDNNTLIRAVLYSNEIRLEGLVYASSEFHWLGDGKGTTQYLPTGDYTHYGLCPCTSWRFAPRERFIDDIVDAYEGAYANLRVHDPNYPAPQDLRSRIRWGNVAFEGDFSADTPGSDLIKSLLLDEQPGPLYVTAQGGESTIARALKSIHDQYAASPQWQSIRDKVTHKLVIVPSGDQDGTGKGYIQPNWPGVQAMEFTGGPDFSYLAWRTVARAQQRYVGAAWTRANVSTRGPLGALYRVWGDGRMMVEGDPSEYYQLAGHTSAQLESMGYMVWVRPQPKGAFLGEGDTGTFLNFAGNGLRAWQYPRWGGWAGVLRDASAPSFDFGLSGVPVLPADTDGIARGLAPAGSTANAPQVVKTREQRIAEFKAFVDMVNKALPAGPAASSRLGDRFLAAAQDDFAARLKWSVTPRYADANHPPEVTIKGPAEVTARAGDVVTLEATVVDPDHDAIRHRWWVYQEAGSYQGAIVLAGPRQLKTSLRVPADARPGQAIHVILEVTDQGRPSLTRYARVVVTVR